MSKQVDLNYSLTRITLVPLGLQARSNTEEDTEENPSSQKIGNFLSPYELAEL